MKAQRITVKNQIEGPREKVWDYWTDPEHIKQWNQASPEWHTPAAENDLRENGKFSYRMEAKNGSAGFDFEGVYEEVQPYHSIRYVLGDGRKVSVHFREEGGSTVVEENFEIEHSNSEAMQREGWQSILDQFKRYVENN